MGRASWGEYVVQLDDTHGAGAGSARLSVPMTQQAWPLALSTTGTASDPQKRHTFVHLNKNTNPAPVHSPSPAILWQGKEGNAWPWALLWPAPGWPTLPAVLRLHQQLTMLKLKSREGESLARGLAAVPAEEGIGSLRARL